MRTIADLLRSVDPFLEEPVWSPHERLTVRQIVLERSRKSIPASLQSRRPFVIALATGCLVLLAGVTVIPRLWSPGVEAAVRFEVRLAEVAPGPGLQQVDVPASGRSIYLHREVIVENSDIRAAKVIPGSSPSTFGVEITLSQNGAEKMSRATQEHLGRPVAIVIDGKVVAAPTVRARIGTSAVISGNFTRAEANRIANGMIGR
jgi:SecD-like export protein